MHVAVEHMEAVARLTLPSETSGCGFSGCADRRCLFREIFAQWLRIMSSEIWKDVFSHTICFLSSPPFRACFCVRSVSLWATTNGINWTGTTWNNMMLINTDEQRRDGGLEFMSLITECVGRNSSFMPVLHSIEFDQSNLVIISN